MPGQWFDPWTQDTDGSHITYQFWYKNGLGEHVQNLKPNAVYNVCYVHGMLKLTEATAGNVVGILYFDTKQPRNGLGRAHFSPLAPKLLKVIPPTNAKTNVRVANEQAFFDLGDIVEFALSENPNKRIACGIRKA